MVKQDNRVQPDKWLNKMVQLVRMVYLLDKIVQQV